MTTTQTVQARVDGEIVEEASAVLATMGLTVSDAVRFLLTRIAREKEFPFEPLIPNETTTEAMKEIHRENLPEYSTVKELLDDLNAENQV